MYTFKRIAMAALVTAALGVGPLPASAAATFFFNNTPYLSAADIPAGFYLGGSPTLLDDLEDGSLDASLSPSAGGIVGPGAFDGLRDSVDGDDGNIDGTTSPQSTAGSSWFFINGPVGVTFTFTGAVLPTAFGLVWTDGGFQVTFSALDGDGNSLGSLTEGGFADANSSGGTAEDRFFGVTFEGGIKSIFISNLGGGIEVDHIQYGTMAPPATVPVPAAGWLMLTGAAALVARRRRAR